MPEADPVRRIKKAIEKLEAAHLERDQAILDAAVSGMSAKAIARAVGMSPQGVAKIIRRMGGELRKPSWVTDWGEQTPSWAAAEDRAVRQEISKKARERAAKRLEGGN